MSSDYVKLTNQDNKTVRVAYDSIEVILPQTNAVGSYTEINGTTEVQIAGSTIYTASGARLWVREPPEYVDHMVEAFYEQHEINFTDEDGDEY